MWPVKTACYVGNGTCSRSSCGSASWVSGGGGTSSQLPCAPKSSSNRLQTGTIGCEEDSKAGIVRTDVVEDSLVVACRWCCVASDTALTQALQFTASPQPDGQQSGAQAQNPKPTATAEENDIRRQNGYGWTKRAHAPSLWELPLPSCVASGNLLS